MRETGIDRRMILKTDATAALLAPMMTAAADPPPRARSDGFDFLAGRWAVTHRKLRDRLVGSREWIAFGGTLAVDPILSGLGNFDMNRLDDPAGAYEAHSLRLHNPAAGTWSIWWLDARMPEVGVPVVGGFAGAKGMFYADDRFAGRPIQVRTTYEPLSPGRARWTQAFSVDAGASWEVNWVMDFRRMP